MLVVGVVFLVSEEKIKHISRRAAVEFNRKKKDSAVWTIKQNVMFSKSIRIKEQRLVSFNSQQSLCQIIQSKSIIEDKEIHVSMHLNETALRQFRLDSHFFQVENVSLSCRTFILCGCWLSLQSWKLRLWDNSNNSWFRGLFNQRRAASNLWQFLIFFIYQDQNTTMWLLLRPRFTNHSIVKQDEMTQNKLSS